MQPHMQLDPPGSLFPSNTKYNSSQHGRRLKTRAPENALQAPFAHPEAVSYTHLTLPTIYSV